MAAGQGLAALSDHEVEQILDGSLRWLGDFIKTTRTSRELGLNETARMCRISPKHLSDLEGGANVSIKILLKIAVGLRLRRIRIGTPLEIDAFSAGPSDAEVEAAMQHISRAMYLLTGKPFKAPQHDLMQDGMPDDKRPLAPVLSFHPVRFGAGRENSGSDLPPELASVFEILRDIPTKRIRVSVSGEVTLGEPIHPVSEDYVEVPEFVVAGGELLLRVRGDSLQEWGVHHGDLLVVERRPIAANGETVLALHNGKVIIGRYWTKYGQPRVLLSDDGNVYASSTREGDRLEVYGVINSVISSMN